MNTEKSRKLYEEAVKVLSGGVNSPVRAYKPYPFFVEKGKGSKIYDVDNNAYIDYCLAYGPIVLGHANDEITKAVQEQLSMGTAYGVPSQKEVNLAEEVIRRVPCAQMIRFTNSGTEATMSAIRLARGVTGKKKIIKFEGAYHGAHDAVLVKSGSGAVGKPDSPGVPEEATQNTILVAFNDPESLEKTIRENIDEIACVIVEPIMGNIGCVPPKDGFLKFLRQITEENGIILIFDEVITGFRLSMGGAQEYYGITPDLVTFGKIIGGGFPIGAIAGKTEYMSRFAPSGDVYQAGTFNGNPISITGGIAALKQLDEKFYKDLHEKGSYLKKSLEDVVDDLKLNYQVNGVESMNQIYFNDEEVTDYASAKQSDSKKFMEYFHRLLEKGVFFAPSQFECSFLSNQHSKEDLDVTIEAIESVLKNI